MSSKGAYEFYDYKPAQADMAGEVLDGLRQQPKYISPKYFYDTRGSALFEQITELKEYYLTRTEMSLFNEHLPAIAAALGDKLCLIEYGSGSSKKIRKLLEAITPQIYVPVDISDEYLQQNAAALHKDFPRLDVYPICADITQMFALPEATNNLTKVGFFPGSSIGNFDPQAARNFLENVRETVGLGGALIIGVDRKKDVDVLESAYNDSKGITAEFNLNVLNHLNAQLEANFETSNFEHVARYNPVEGCIQMFLRSTSEQQVSVAGEKVFIGEQENLLTENSYKYHPHEFLELTSGAGFVDRAHWSDAQNWFSLFLLQGC